MYKIGGSLSLEINMFVSKKCAPSNCLAEQAFLADFLSLRSSNSEGARHI